MPYTPQDTANPMKTAPRVLSTLGSAEAMMIYGERGEKEAEKPGFNRSWVDNMLGRLPILDMQ
jgi:hypothetical protein